MTIYNCNYGTYYNAITKMDYYKKMFIQLEFVDSYKLVSYCYSVRNYNYFKCVDFYKVLKSLKNSSCKQKDKLGNISENIHNH